MLRVMGAICVVSGAGAVGFGFAAGVRRQARQLTELCTALETMQAEIEYRMTPLPQLLRELAGICTPPLDTLFIRWSDALSNAQGATVSYALSCALRRTRGLALSAESIQALRTLSLQLGRFDTAQQGRAVGLCAQRLRQELLQLEAGKQTRCRSYQTIAICAGLALAVILL